MLVLGDRERDRHLWPWVGIAIVRMAIVSTAIVSIAIVSSQRRLQAVRQRHRRRVPPAALPAKLGVGAVDWERGDIRGRMTLVVRKIR